MARIITREIALKVAKKLKAKKRKGGGAHDYYDVWEDGKMARSFSIRRGSEKDKGHDHLPKQLGVNAHDTKCLGQCTYTRTQYLTDIGVISEPPPA